MAIRRRRRKSKTQLMMDTVRWIGLYPMITIGIGLFYWFVSEHWAMTMALMFLAYQVGRFRRFIGLWLMGKLEEGRVVAQRERAEYTITPVLRPRRRVPARAKPAGAGA